MIKLSPSEAQNNRLPFFIPSPQKKLKVMKRAVVLALGLLCILGFFKLLQIWYAKSAAAKFRLPAASVTSIITCEEEWIPILHAVGSLQAVHGVTVSADLPGIIESIHFVSGTPVKQGDLLVKLDTRQEEAQLIAAKAKQDLAGYNLKRSQELYMKNVLARSEYDTVAANFQENVGNVKEVEARIARKTIRAPFSGLLGIREVNVGQYIQSGERMVPLQSLDPIYVNFSLPQSHLAELQKSKEVSVHAEGAENHSFKGEIIALNSIVDNSTANFKVQAILENKDALLLPGMFVTVDVHLPHIRKVITVPISAISYAPYGDSLFVIKNPEGIVEQKFVKLGPTRGDRVVIESGLNVGEEVVTSRTFSLRSGRVVQVHNEVQPGNELAPQPADN